MNKRIVGVIVSALLAAGCQGFHPLNADPVVRTMPVDGARLAYVDEGSGAPVVFVHGAFGDWRNWEGFRSAVAERHRFVALSLRYHYPNAWTDDGSRYTLAQHVEDLAAFIRGLDAGKVHLVGNSMGSRVAVYLALKHPELIRSLTLGDPFIVAPGSAEGKAAIAAFQKDAGLSSTAAKAGDLNASAELMYNAVLDDAKAFENSSAEARRRTLDNARSMGPYWKQPAAAPVTCAQLGEVKIPTLVVMGAESRAIFRHGVEALAGCMPTAKVVRLPGGRHNWFAEMPREGAAAVVEFVSTR